MGHHRRVKGGVWMDGGMCIEVCVCVCEEQSDRK